VPGQLKRYYGAKHLHFITCSCYHRLPVLGTPQRRDLFLDVLERARQRYRFVVVGYVVMPEHIHLLISEPQRGDPSVVMKVVKQEFARTVHRRERYAGQPGIEAGNVWQRRFYDFNVWTEHKRIEKLRYMHRNPVKRGLVREPEQWLWSSFRFYAYGKIGTVRVNFQEWPLKIKPRPRETFGRGQLQSAPLIRKERE
jgi:putative transposase